MQDKEDIDWSNLAADYQVLGMSRIAKKYNVSISTVWRRIHKEGIEIIRPARGQRPRIDWSSLAVDSKTMTPMQIAQKYECSRRTVNHRLQKLRERGLLD